MPTGRCFCGEIRIEFGSDPVTSGICHCTDCRKHTSSPHCPSFFFKTPDIKVSGSPKQAARPAHSTRQVRNYFCSHCGTPLYGQRVDSHGTPEYITVVRAGIFDRDFLDKWKPQAEIFTDCRVNWLKPVEGMEQFAGAYGHS